MLLAAFQTLLFRYTGQDDLCVGTPVAGRRHLETEGLIGCFVNTLVLRGDLSGDPTFRDVVRRAHEVVLEAQTHQDLPFERLVDLLSLPRDPARQPLFQVALVMQNMPIPEPRLRSLAVESLDIDTGTAKFDLTMQVEDTGGGLAGSLEYSTDLFDDAKIDRLLGHFRTLLEGAAADPDRRIAELPLLPQDERRDLLEIPDAPSPETAGAPCLHEMFERRARLAPAATALTFEDQALSYEELDSRAERVARTA